MKTMNTFTPSSSFALPTRRPLSPRRPFPHLPLTPSPSLPLLLILPLLFAGCAQDATNLQSARDQSAITIAEARTRESQLSQQLSTLPSNDPLRQRLQPQLDKLDQFINQAQSQLPKLDAAIKAAQTPPQPLDPTLQQTLSAIPYGSIAVAILGLSFATLKHLQSANLLTQYQQSQKAFQQIVQALDSILPTPTPDQQLKLNAALDTDVKAKLAATRA